ncbi:cholesterol 7-desaturase nvd [Ischnura elegans]|uniref:cholesterol 7-desaturase nvd n=1 Tax=Ischnura elegans TaxID=197161 RepID=UPI001ED8A7C5|nr:cholesterol 7-desaturase nvd [Ischnura elegans]XP_046385249.1 cholesterol 7-desaturase nvd [Ischnura elegans]
MWSGGNDTSPGGCVAQWLTTQLLGDPRPAALPEWWFRASPQAVVAALLAAAVALAAWRLLFKPIEWTRGLEDVGFGHLSSQPGMVASARRLRRHGALPPPFPNGWFALMESGELHPGQVAHICALGETFAVFREEASAGARAHVLGAYCPHLGANMAAGGRVRADCLECPFHGWQFRGRDGQCTSVPYSTNKVPEFARAKRWPSIEVNHVIFVWYHAEGAEPSWVLEELPEVQSGDWQCKGRSTFHVNCHIQEIPENGADVAHLNAVHSPLLTSGGDLRKSGGSRLASHSWVASWAPNEDERHRATMKLRHELRFLGKYLIMSNDIVAHQIGPGYVVLNIQTIFGKVIILQTVTPIEPMIQKVTHRLYGSKFVIQPFANFMFLGETIMFERDMMVWNHKMYLDRPILVSEDRAITRYRRWYGQFYSGSSGVRSKTDLLKW